MKRNVDGADRKKRSDAITDEEVKEIEEFFLRGDISRMCPGGKDCVSVKMLNGGKEQRQKRLLLLNISEAYELFKQESHSKAGKSKFASLRPPQVVPKTLRDQEVCMCKYHENIELILEGLQKILPRVATHQDKRIPTFH